MTEQPLGDRVLVEVINTGDEKTTSGIIIQEASKSVQRGKVVAVGTGLFTSSGKKIPMTVSEGDIVTFTPGSGTNIRIDGEDYRIFRESDFFTHKPPE